MNTTQHSTAQQSTIAPMPPGVNADRHTAHDEEGDLIDISSGDDISNEGDPDRQSDEATSEEDEDDDYTDEESDDHHRSRQRDRIHEEDLEVTADTSWDGFDDGGSYIEPSDSASRSRQPAVLPRSTSQRYYPSSSRPPGRRINSARDYASVPDPPSVPLPRRGSRRRPARTRSVTSAAMHEDEYGYGEYGRYNAPYTSHSGPSREYDPYAGSRSVLSAYDDSYYGADPNPFTMPPEHGYQSRHRGNRASMGPRYPSSGHEVMSLGHYGQYGPYGIPPGFAPYAHPSYGFGSMPSNRDQQDREEERKRAQDKVADAVARLKIEEENLVKMQKLIQQQQDEQEKREKRAEAARQAEAQAKALAEFKSMEEKIRADEKKEAIKAAADKAKAEAEKAATKKAEEEKAKFDKEMDEIKKKAAKLEEEKKKLEAEAKALRPDDDKLKPPIRFKDAVGRKFSFPWHVCKTWKGMESLILQAFSHVDNIGPLVVDGHYDLIGPDGEIILPQIWETMIKPDMPINMMMWPLPEKKKAVAPPPHPGLFNGELSALMNGGGPGKPKKGIKAKDKKIKGPMMPGPPFPMPPGVLAPPPPVGMMMDGHMMMPPPPAGMLPAGITLAPEPKKSKSKDSSSKKKSSSSSKGILGWVTGAPPKKESKKKK